MRLSAWLAGAALALLVPSVPAMSAEFRLLQLGGDFVKWGEPELGTGATVTYAFAAGTRHFDNARNCTTIEPLDVLARRTGIPQPALEREFGRAVAAWEQVADIRFRRAGTAAAADIVVGVQSRPRGRAFANVLPMDRYPVGRARPGEKTRLTVFTAHFGPAAREGRRDVAPIEQSLICLNPTLEWKIGFDGNSAVYDLRYTFMHEIGHALGLDHPSSSGELMSFRYDETFRAPQEGDIAGAELLYGPRRNHH